jgi:hypothetical protein
MPRSQSALVRIVPSLLGLAICAALSVAVMAATTSPKSGGSADPHKDHHPAAAAQTASAPSAPARSSAITTPSWFTGGESLYVPYYFDTFDGLDLSDLTAPQKERFLHKVNTEFCSCNQTACRRDTIAHCYLTDKACPRAPVRIRGILEQAKAWTGTGQPAPATITITPKP